MENKSDIGESTFKNNSMKSILTLFAAGLISFPIHAATSPFATTNSGVALNQSATDDLNGLLATGSQVPQSGSLAALTDASSSSSPTGTVIVGPDSGPASLTWDFGTTVDAALRRLSTVSLWFDNDADRAGFNGSLATSLDGFLFTEIENSSHEAAFNFSPGLFHNVIYNFDGTNVTNFRYIRINSFGYVFPVPPGNPAFQPLFVEADIFTVVVPEPSTLALLVAGVGVMGFSCYRKNRRA